MSYGNDLATAARLFEHALSLEPSNLDIIRNASQMAQTLGRIDDAILLGEYIIARDPLAINVHENLGSMYISKGRLDDALASNEIALSLSPDRIGGQYFVAVTLLLQGQAEAALATFAKEGDDEYRVKGTALSLYSLGRQEEYEAALAELEERWGDRWPSDIAEVYAWAGDLDSAFTWLEKQYADSGNLNGIAQDPFMRNLHDDPRWQALLEKSGQSADQLAAIEFNVKLPE